MFRRPVLLAIFVVSCLVTPRATFAQHEPTRPDITAKDIESCLDDEWLGIYFQGTKIGYMNSKLTKEVEKGVTIYRETNVMNMKLQSAGTKSELKIEERLDFESKPPFRLVSAEYTHNDDKIIENFTLEATNNEKEYEAIIVVGTVEQKKKINLDFVLADNLGVQLWLRQKPAKGAEITTRELELDSLKVELSTTTMLGTKDSLVNGVKVIFHEVKSVSHKSKIEGEFKYDDKGGIISGTMAGTFEMRREKPEDAKNTEFSSDLFLMGMAKLDKALGTDAAKVSALVLEFKNADGGVLPEGPRQSLIRKTEGVYHLQLGKKYGKAITPTAAEIKEALEETTAYPVSDAKVKELAKLAAGAAATDHEKAKNICQFVHNYIEPTLAATIPKMHDLITRKSGDCKSYALMFTCLARAAGLPTREVSGFVYMGDGVKSFGGHAWNEVVLNGVWVPLDASMNQAEADATHICLGTEKDAANNLLKTFGKLNFKLVNVEFAP